MLGVRPQLLELPSGVRDLYEVVISHLRERAHLAATARGVFNPHLIGDQPIAQSASAVAPQELAELLHARLQPVSPYACPHAPPAPGPRPTAAQPAASYLAEVLHKALSPSSPSVSPPEALPPRPRLPSPPSPLPGSADPRGVWVYYTVQAAGYWVWVVVCVKAEEVCRVCAQNHSMHQRGHRLLLQGGTCRVQTRG